MFCSISINSPVQLKEIVICMGTKMKTNQKLEIHSLLPAERIVVVAFTGSLLTALGSLLKEHPDLRANLSPNASQTLMTIGEKLIKASNSAGA